MLGRVALRFIMEADLAEHVDRMITSLPIWPRVTPLIALDERHEPLKEMLELGDRASVERAVVFTPTFSSTVRVFPHRSTRIAKQDWVSR